ncbi:MAG: YfiR family protein [Pseudomonadota bacterium]|nr:YfiR family protein [Pseudomonadota bacterium]MDE3037735.1 YfiR family protein [Pseudomonadota bacterium]
MLKRFLPFGIALCLACVSAFAPSPARADGGSNEYLVKAAFIYNFIKYVEWPGDKAVSAQSNIDVCVVGQSGLNDAGSVFTAASTPRLKLTLTEEKSLHAIPRHCHILFVARSEEDRLDKILAALKGKPVLTVSDIGRFAERGGMIGFMTEDNKIKLVINTRPATVAGMRIDAQLLEIALKVIER